MTAAVTCLEHGERGEIVRVRGQEGRIFRARVAGPALVEALLAPVRSAGPGPQNTGGTE